MTIGRRLTSGDNPARRRRLRGQQLIRLLLVAIAAVTGVILVVVGIAQQQSPPEPDAAAAGSVQPSGISQPSSSSPSMASTSRATGPPSDWPRSSAGSAQSPRRSTDPSSAEPSPQEAPRAWLASPPLHLSIPAIKVDTIVTTVGVTSGGALGVPSGKRQNEAAWFRDSPTPGQFGASVIVGHIDTIHGPSVFYDLGALHPGDTIVIRRKDHLKITFVVDGVRQYPDRKNLPIEDLYGGDPDRAGLRLVTCSNFDHSIGHYRGNLIVYAHAQHT